MFGSGALSVGPDPPHQVGAGRCCLAPQGEGEEPAIGEQQHAGLQPGEQPFRRGGLGVGVLADLGGEHRVRPALRKSHHSSLRERRLLTFVHPGSAEERRILRGSECDSIQGGS